MSSHYHIYIAKYFSQVETITLKITVRPMSWHKKCSLPVCVRGPYDYRSNWTSLSRITIILTENATQCEAEGLAVISHQNFTQPKNARSRYVFGLIMIIKGTDQLSTRVPTAGEHARLFSVIDRIVKTA